MIPSPTQTKSSVPEEFLESFLLYPCYINSNKTLDQGRRINKALCISDPTAKQIYTVMTKQLGLKAYLEKTARHPQDWGPAGSGRIRYHLVDKNTSTSTLLNPNISSKKSLLKTVSEILLKEKALANAAVPTTVANPTGPYRGRKNKSKKNKKSKR